jgi:hypothetical protein
MSKQGNFGKINKESSLTILLSSLVFLVEHFFFASPIAKSIKLLARPHLLVWVTSER